MPTKIRILHGENEKKRLNAEEPQPREISPVPPDHLTPYAREVWDRTVRELGGMGLAFDCDRDVLGAFCIACARHRDACILLSKSGFLLRSKQEGTNPYVNPLVYVERTQAELMIKLAGQFGLTPSARVHLKADHEVMNRDGVEDLLSG